jgi:hypothetical protein
MVRVEDLICHIIPRSLLENPIRPHEEIKTITQSYAEAARW